MTKFFLITVGVLLLAAVVFFFLWRIAIARKKSAENEVFRFAKTINSLSMTVQSLKNTIDVLKKNREEADEKIDSLHNGDSVSNAIDELSKRKS